MNFRLRFDEYCIFLDFIELNIIYANIQAARAALTQFAFAIKSLPPDVFEPIGNLAIAKFKTSANNFDEADFIIRDGLFSVYLAWGQYSEAAQALAGVNVDSTTRPYSDTEKADIFVKCAGNDDLHMLVMGKISPLCYFRLPFSFFVFFRRGISS